MQNDPGSQYPRRRGFGISPRLIIVALMLMYGAYYYFSNRQVQPETGEKILIDRSLSAEQESNMGLQAFQEVLQQEQQLPADSELSQQVSAIAQRLVAVIPQVSDALAAEHNAKSAHVEKSFNWQVAVLKSDQVNAFCLPGGKMAVYTGLIPVAQNADAMAVVMGHEISHALLRHGAQRMAKQRLEQIGAMAGAMSGMDPSMQQAVFSAYGVTSQLPFARHQESQADEFGLMLAAAACFNPEESIALWQRMDQVSGGQAQPEFSSTHPSAGTRIKELQALMPKAMEYRARFCKNPGGTQQTASLR